MYLAFAGVFMFLALGLLLCYYAIEEWVHQNVTLPMIEEMKQIHEELEALKVKVGDSD